MIQEAGARGDAMRGPGPQFRIAVWQCAEPATECARYIPGSISQDAANWRPVCTHAHSGASHTRLQFARFRKLAPEAYRLRYASDLSLRNPANSPLVCDGTRGPMAGIPGCVTQNVRNPQVCTALNWFDFTYLQLEGSRHKKPNNFQCTHPTFSATSPLRTQHTAPELARTRKVSPGACRTVGNRSTHHGRPFAIPQDRSGCVTRMAAPRDAMGALAVGRRRSGVAEGRSRRLAK